jgi:hypothetical protein
MKWFDEKQHRLVNSWYDLSLKTEDYYMSFMSAWIAFNAICYNLYHSNACIERANIDRKKSRLGLETVHSKLSTSTTFIPEKTVINKSKDKWHIQLTVPGELHITINENYTEDILFNEFVAGYQKWYQAHPSDSFEMLKNSLEKKTQGGPRYFVINMAKVDKYKSVADVDEMANRNIVVLCEKNELKTVKNVLYQIRCNIFHGEKTPGVLNDDRIVKSALPLLKYLVEHLMHDNGLVKNSSNSPDR